MNDPEIKVVLESILFIAEGPVTFKQFCELFQEKCEKEQLRKLLDELKGDFEGRALQLVEVAGGYQLCTRSEYAEWVRGFKAQERKTRLSPAALETLAIVAYRQPITRVEIDEIRGVDSSTVLKTLLERRLVRILGRRRAPGNPLTYGSTREFLEYFGLKDLKDLPTLSEFSPPEEMEIYSHEAEASKDPGTSGDLLPA